MMEQFIFIFIWFLHPCSAMYNRLQKDLTFANARISVWKYLYIQNIYGHTLHGLCFVACMPTRHCLHIVLCMHKNTLIFHNLLGVWNRILLLLFWRSNGDWFTELRCFAHETDGFVNKSVDYRNRSSYRITYRRMCVGQSTISAFTLFITSLHFHYLCEAHCRSRIAITSIYSCMKPSSPIWIQTIFYFVSDRWVRTEHHHRTALCHHHQRHRAMRKL